MAEISAFREKRQLLRQRGNNIGINDGTSNNESCDVRQNVIKVTISLFPGLRILFLKTSERASTTKQ